MCDCSGVSWNGLAAGPHRYGSSCGKFGCCEHHPSHSEKMYTLMDAPVLRAGKTRTR